MKLLITILFAAALAAAGFASLSVESFTCNSQSGTVVAETGATLVCQASVKNGDSQNSAAFNSAKLLVSGVWTDATSYTGGGFDTTISAGGSTTATFTGISAVSPGPTNKFQAILLDDATDTFVADTTVNVLAVKSITAASTLSSATEGQQFRVDSTVIVGGDPSSATLSVSLSGCSLASGETATKSIGDVSNNDVISRSWQMIQGSSNCQITVTGSLIASSVTVQRTTTATVTNPNVGSSGSSSSSSSSSSGGGGGGAASAQTKATIVKESPNSIKATFSSIAKDKEAVIEIPDDVDAGVTKLTFTASRAIGSSYVNVRSLDSMPPSVTKEVEAAKTYKYIEILHNISEGAISSAKLYFDVEKSWLSANDIDADKIHLNRYNEGKWDRLSTSRTNETSEKFSYSALSPGFSVFAISGEVKTSLAEQTSGQAEKPSTAKQPGTQQPASEIIKVVSDYGIYILIVVIAVVLVLGYFYYHGHRHLKKAVMVKKLRVKSA